MRTFPHRFCLDTLDILDRGDITIYWRGCRLAPGHYRSYAIKGKHGFLFTVAKCRNDLTQVLSKVVALLPDSCLFTGIELSH